MSLVAQNDAIRQLRRAFNTVPQRQFARELVTGDRFISTSIAGRSFFSVYSVIRRHDQTEKAKQAIAIPAPVRHQSAC